MSGPPPATTGTARFRSDFPYRRIAVVLSGGGALGAYEAGVLAALERTGVRPSVMAGVSVGAINALLWIAHGFRTAALIDTWTRLSSAGIGLRWTTLAVRALGMLLVALAGLEVALSLGGSPELGVWRWLRGGDLSADVSSVLLDVAAWIVVGLFGALIARLSRRAEDILARLGDVASGGRWQRWTLRGLLVLGSVHLVTWGAGWPWPHRFSATVLVLGTLLWLFNGPWRGSLRTLLIRMLPETAGRGAWGSAARQRLIQRVLSQGNPRDVIDRGTRLLISACALDTGRMCYFINWPRPSEGFVARVERALGEVRVLRRPRDAVMAAVASSALPLVYEPVRIGDRDYVDGAVFANQPLRVLVPEEADAVLVVLLSPSAPLSQPGRDAHLVDLGARLLEMANWRDLQAELAALPEGWRREPDGATPARVCVVEPEDRLPGGVLGFDAGVSRDLTERGARDAMRALRDAGWLEEGDPSPVATGA